MLPEHKNRDKLVDEVVFLEGMISNLLLSDKLSIPYTNVQNDRVKVSNLLIKVIDLVNVSLEKFNVQNEIPQEYVIIDETKMIIALRNLIDNALKYGSSDHPIVIHVFQKNNIFIVEVKNRGDKIQERDGEDIFLPFFRSTNNKNRVSGFGLGLTICKKIAEAHGGKLLMTSTDQETNFSIEIPIKK